MFPDSRPPLALFSPERGSPEKERGFGLPFAIFVVVILAMIAAAITQLETDSAESVVFDVQSTRAFLAAQSGAQIGLNALFPPGVSASNCTHSYFSSSPSITFASSGLEGCTALVSCGVSSVAGDDYFTVSSLGSCGAGLDLAQRRIEVKIR